MYDSVINKKALKILIYAPALMFLLGYWALGNRQIFFNIASEKKFFNSIDDP